MSFSFACAQVSELVIATAFPGWSTLAHSNDVPLAHPDTAEMLRGAIIVVDTIIVNQVQNPLKMLCSDNPIRFS